MSSNSAIVLSFVGWTSGARVLRPPLRRPIAALGAALAAVVGLGGCAGQMPAPIGLTAASGTTVVYNRSAAFSVGVVPNRAPPVRIGDEVGFALSASRPGYGHLYLLNASGAVLMLVENLDMAEGAQTIFPTPGSGFTFRASPPPGVERILFLVTRQPFRGFGDGVEGPAQFPATAREFIIELNAATGKLPARDWALAEARIEVVPAEG